MDLIRLFNALFKCDSILIYVLDVKVTYEDSTNDSTPNPLKGSEFRMTARFDPNLGDINFCTVKEVFLNQSLHFSEPKDDNHPDVTT